MNKKCFSYASKKECQVLTDNSSCGRNCPFRKTAAQFEADKKAAEKRLASLPQEQRQYIAETYYGRKYPDWNPKVRKAVAE